jgi:membrane peptidoglycan carboxypeptidase
MNSYINTKSINIFLNTFDKKTSKLKNIISIIILIIAIILLVISGVILSIAKKDYDAIPSLKNSITNYYGKESSVIVDKNGKLLYDYRQRTKKEPLTESEMPDLMKFAILVREDENFYYSSGFSWKNFLGAVLSCTKGRLTNNSSDCRGGSGIFQQLIKNFDNTQNDRSVENKYNELLRSLKASEEISLNEALLLYLNNMDFGRLSKGAQIGSRSFFGHSITDTNKLNPSKACFLALMPNQPTGYTTATRNMLIGDGDKDNRATYKWSYVKELINLCVDKLASSKIMPDKPTILTKDEAEKWKKYDIESQITKDIIDPNEQSKHYIKDYIEEVLLNKYKDIFPDRTALENGIYNKKMIIKTTFDLEKQNELEETINKNKQYFANNDINQVASAVTDVKTGELVAFIGNLNYSDSEISRLTGEYGNILPGSSSKPYYFASTFESGYNPTTILLDGEYIDPVIGNKRVNDVVGKYEGFVNLRYGLQQSINTIAEQTAYINQDGNDFAYKKGINNSTDFAKKIGLKYVENESTKNCLSNIQVIIGNCYVNGLSHLNAYNTLANQGIYNEIRPVISIIENEKVILNENQAKLPYKSNSQVVDKGIANQIMDVTSDYDTRRSVTGSRSNDAINYEIEGWNGPNKVSTKSGTAQIYFDNKNMVGEVSVIGASAKYSTLLWAGRSDKNGTKLPIKVSSSGITPIYKSIVTNLHKNITPSGFSKEGLIQTKINPLTGALDNNGKIELLTQNQIDKLKNISPNISNNIFQNRNAVVRSGECSKAIQLLDNYRFTELQNYINNTFSKC